MAKTIIGIFGDKKQAEATINELKNQGFHPEDISIIMRHDGKVEKKTGVDTNIAGGALRGAETGVVVGGLAGILAGTVVPGLRSLLIGGPIGTVLGLTGVVATTVSGMATGAVAGGLIGALIKLGLSREDAKRYEKHIREGSILVAVPTTDTAFDSVMDYFVMYHAMDIKSISMPSERMAEVKTAGRGERQFAFATYGTKGGQSEKRHEEMGKKAGKTKARRRKTFHSSSIRGRKGGFASRKSKDSESKAGKKGKKEYY